MSLLISRLLLLITIFMGPIFIQKPYLSAGYIAGCVVSTMVNLLLKRIFLQLRPNSDLEYFKTSLKYYKNDPSFIMNYCGMPSGHAQLVGFALTYIFLATHYWWIWAVVTIFAIGVCIQRVWTGAHTVLQVMVGLCVGIALGILTYTTVVRFLKL